MENQSLKSRREFLRMSGTAALAGAAGSLLFGCASKSTPVSSQLAPLPIAAKAGGKNVRTVRGLMAAEHLGITDMHEHVLRDKIMGTAEALMTFDAETLKKLAPLSDPDEVPERFFPEKGNPISLQNRYYLTHYYANAKDQFLLDEKMMLGELRDYAALGGKSILDCSPTYERGTPTTVRRMSAETGVNIIMSTGINSNMMLPAKFKKMNVKELTNFFEKEIFVGIDDTDVCCGNIKLLADSIHYGTKATEDQPLLHGLEAAASVCRNSGVPVTVHAFMLGDKTFEEFLEIAIKFGMPKDKMVLSHFSSNLFPLMYKTLMKNPELFAPKFDMGYWAMDRGFVLSFDLFGAGAAWAETREGMVPEYDPISLAAIYQYVKAGYGDRLVIGTDLWMRSQSRKNGGAGIAHMLNFVVPMLLENGLTQKEVDQILIHTPARLLAC
ncbi:twin-arginine translocation signal domain-containing protein [Cystobacter fuscus]|uniref:phosphotriesterase family protein n=1 Tax=Cystobacter fuscus TaxID=43 RepID=UPI002B2EEC62|nr:twin-arginine translocation signal domain-containing protein [Cystobacter fuscus]